MRYFFRAIEVEFIVGANIEESINDALQLAKEHKCIVEFSFNSSKFRVVELSRPNVLLNKWRERQGVIKDDNH